MSPEELAAAVGGPLGTVGQAFYFHPDTLGRGKELGLDGFRFYMLGRGGVLGDVEAPVIQSAFGYFAAGTVNKIWNSAKEVMAPREAAREYLECCRNLGRTSLADIEGLDAFNAAAEKVVEAADPAALALFAGLAAEPLAQDREGRAIQLAATLRELRGSVHLVAVVASGLTPYEAHALKRPGDLAMFGWPEDAPPLTDDHRSRHEAAESLTNTLLGSAFAVLSDAEGEALLAGARALDAALNGG